MKKPFLFGIDKNVTGYHFLSTNEVYDLVGHNTGNLAFHYAIDSHLGGNLKSIGWIASAEQLRAEDTTIIMPMANQLGYQFNLGDLATKIVEAAKPIVVIGLGAQSNADNSIPQIPQGTLDWIRAVYDNSPTDAPNIAVRGAFSQQVLAHYGLSDRSMVTGCPSLFINPNPKLGRLISSRIKNPQRIAVLAGHPEWIHLSSIEASLARMVTATQGSYIGQSPLEILKITRGESSLLEDKDIYLCRDYISPEISVEQLVLWCQRHGNVFFDIPSWMEHYRRFDFAIGTRIHGVVLALQAGIPAMCIVHDSRTLELCLTMKIPFVHFENIQSGLTIEEMMDFFKFESDVFDENRIHLCKNYVKFLLGNQLTPEAWLLDLANHLPN